MSTTNITLPENDADNTYYPITIINNTNNEVNFHVFNPDSKNGFIHLDYGNAGTGYRTVGIPGNSQITGIVHVNTGHPVSEYLNSNSPGHLDIAPDQSPGGTIILIPYVIFVNRGLQEEVTGNLTYLTNGYRGPYSFALYYDEAGTDPVPVTTTLNLSQPLYFILSY